jgi:large subunit ribosomal protein L23
MNIERKYSIILGPHTSEKTAGLGENKMKQIAFKVIKTASKAEIKKSVEAIFDVKVDSVQTANVKPKTRVFKGILGKRKAWKKAYVSLKEGFDIDFSDNKA